MMFFSMASTWISRSCSVSTVWMTRPIFLIRRGEPSSGALPNVPAPSLESDFRRRFLLFLGAGRGCNCVTGAGTLLALISPLGICGCPDVCKSF